MRKILFHGTSFEGLLSIFHTDNIASFDSCGVLGASLTSSFEVAEIFACAKSTERASDVQWHIDVNLKRGENFDYEEQFSPLQVAEWVVDPLIGGGGAIIEFDADKLSKLYPIQSIDEIGDDSEKEFRLLGYRLDGIVSCITSVSIKNVDSFDHYCDELIGLDEKYLTSIPAVNSLISGPRAVGKKSRMSP